MPYRLLAASKLSEFLSAIAHARRIQIVEELWSGETDVGSLKETLGISHSNVSQHLAVLRAHRVVTERREGRRVFYRLCCVELAEWLVDGMRLLPAVAEDVGEVKSAIRDAKAAWTESKTASRGKRRATDDNT